MKTQLVAALRQIRAGEWEDAWRELDKLTPSEQQHSKVIELRLTILEALEYWEGALAMAENAIAAGHRDPLICVLGAIAVRELHSADAAMEFLRKGEPWSGSVPIFLFLRASVEAESGYLAAAKKDLATALQHDSRLRLQALAQPEFRPLRAWLRKYF